ncbi:MAG: TldD/PmbA family protein, partial [Nitrospirae bacterium]|nr:TldD/PmbA family protein [Nitrospirota bacterium]
MRIISDEQFSRVLKKALSRGGDYADVFIEHRQHVSMQLEDNKIEKIVSGTDAGAGIRVIFGNKSAYAYSNDLSKDSLLGLADAVSRATNDKKDISINLKKRSPHLDFEIKQNPRSVSADKKIFLLESANAIARKVSPEIRQVTANYRDMIQNVYIATSEGAVSEDERIH